MTQVIEDATPKWMTIKERLEYAQKKYSKLEESIQVIHDDYAAKIAVMRTRHAREVNLLRSEENRVRLLSDPYTDKELHDNSWKLDGLVDWIASWYKIDSAIVRGPSRKFPVRHARQVYMYVARKSSKASLKEIASHCSGRDHSTVIWSIRKVQDQIDAYEEYAEEIDQIMKSSKIEYFRANPEND